MAQGVDDQKYNWELVECFASTQLKVTKNVNIAHALERRIAGYGQTA